jgi:uncharacterized protein (DUF486 family)
VGDAPSRDGADDERKDTGVSNGALCIIGLSVSNVFMTLAWYGHLKTLPNRSWLVAALASWGIALFEYLVQVPSNRVGHQVFDVAQLKIIQEAITLAVFVPFSLFFLGERPTLNYLWAGLCIMGAVFFIFRGAPALAR